MTGGKKSLVVDRHFKRGRDNRLRGSSTSEDNVEDLVCCHYWMGRKMQGKQSIGENMELQKTIGTFKSKRINILILTKWGRKKVKM